MKTELEYLTDKYTPIAYEMIEDGEMEKVEVMGMILAFASIMDADFVDELIFHLKG